MPAAFNEEIADTKPVMFSSLIDSAISLKEDAQLLQSGNFRPFHYSQILFMILIDIT